MNELPENVQMFDPKEQRLTTHARLQASYNCVPSLLLMHSGHIGFRWTLSSPALLLWDCPQGTQIPTGPCPLLLTAYSLMSFDTVPFFLLLFH